MLLPVSSWMPLAVMRLAARSVPPSGRLGQVARPGRGDAGAQGRDILGGQGVDGEVVTILGRRDVGDVGGADPEGIVGRASARGFQQGYAAGGEYRLAFPRDDEADEVEALVEQVVVQLVVVTSFALRQIGNGGVHPLLRRPLRPKLSRSRCRGDENHQRRGREAQLAFLFSFSLPTPCRPRLLRCPRTQRKGWQHAVASAPEATSCFTL